MAANARLSPRTQYDSEWECNSEEAELAEPFAPADEEHAPADVAGGPGLRPSGPSSPSGGHSAQSLKFTGKQLFIATAPQDGRGACFASAVAAAVAATTCQARSGSEPSRGRATRTRQSWRRLLLHTTGKPKNAMCLSGMDTSRRGLKTRGAPEDRPWCLPQWESCGRIVAGLAAK
ncbi:unnamed protein product [Effrenium voratum]|nr:unnamed protein product [Effrenium voratum]